MLVHKLYETGYPGLQEKKLALWAVLKKKSFSS